MKEISAAELASQRVAVERRYGSALQSAGLRVVGPTRARQLADVVSQFGARFVETFYAVHQRVGADADLVPLRTPRTVSLRYAAHVAGRVVAAGALSNGGAHMQGQVPVRVSFGEENDISLVREMLDGLVEYADARGRVPQVAHEYFSAYSDVALHAFSAVASSEAVTCARETRWSVLGRDVLGVIAESSDLKPDARSAQRERSGPQERLEDLGHVGARALPRAEIIGDENILSGLETQLDLLFGYDPVSDINAYAEMGLFENAVLLQGSPGLGKSVVLWYLADRAQRIASEEQCELSVVRLNVHSSWKAGEIINLRRQLKQISEDNQLYVVCLDEIDRLLDTTGRGDEQQHLISEFNSFLDGEYRNKGNYFVIGTINDARRLRPSNVSRLTVYSWQGPQNDEDYARLFTNELLRYVPPEKVAASPQEIAGLAAEAREMGLTGRDIKKVCRLSRRDALHGKSLRGIRSHTGNPEALRAYARSRLGSITSGQLREQLSSYALHRERSLADSVGVDVYAAL